MAGVRLVPYRLPELLAAIRNSGLILIAEGERKVDLLRHWGFVATCNVSGAIRSKLWFDHAKEFFSAGCYAPKIIVLPDKDDAGRKHADTIGAAFAAVGITVHILDLPGLRNKEDVINWYDRGGTAERLRDLIEHDARPWAPSERLEVNSEAFARNRPKSGGQIVLPPPPDRASLTVSAWLDKDIPERDFLLGAATAMEAAISMANERFPDSGFAKDEPSRSRAHHAGVPNMARATARARDVSRRRVVDGDI